MQFLRSNFLTLTTLLVLIIFVFLFTKIVVYLVTSVVLALIGKPLHKFLSNLKIGKFRLPSGLNALLTLIGLYSIFFLFFYLFIPLMATQVRFLFSLDFTSTFHAVLEQLPALKKILLSFGSEDQIRHTIDEQSNRFMNFQNLRSWANDAASLVTTLAAGLLSVSFITFFLLKEERMVFTNLLLITPSKYEKQMIEIIRTSRFMLTKYFTGLLLDVILVTLLVGSSLYFMGIKNAFVIGVFAGIMNIIPYIGPLISLLFALVLGLTGCLEVNQLNHLGLVLEKIFFVLIIVNILDAFIFQPFIFSSSVRAHPLEIFLVILMAGTLAGVMGMVIAIPTYTLIRIVAREFLANFRFFRKITEKLPD